MNVYLLFFCILCHSYRLHCIIGLFFCNKYTIFPFSNAQVHDYKIFSSGSTKLQLQTQEDKRTDQRIRFVFVYSTQITM